MHRWVGERAGRAGKPHPIVIILDTNVVSEPLRPHPDAGVIEWLDRQGRETLFLTTISVAELRAGVEQLPAGRRRSTLSDVLDRQLRVLFGGRILDFDGSAADAFGRVHAAARKSGNPIQFADCAIAAIARAHRFAVATRDSGDFAGTGVEIFDPWNAPGGP